MKMLYFLALLQLFIISTNSEAGNDSPLASLEDIKILPVVELRKMLSQRGLECKGCTDKEDYIKMAFENQHLPILPPPATPEPVREKDDPLKKKEVDDIMESLKKSGFGGAKMYTKDDLKDMSPEGMAEKFGASGAKTSRGSRKAKASAKGNNDEKKKEKKEKIDKKEKKEKKSPKKSGKKDQKKSRFSSNRPRETKPVEKEEKVQEEEDRIEL